MAHATDYPSQRDISKLRKSPSTMNRKSYHPQSHHAQTLVSNFLHSNPNWAIDSLVKYLLSQYSDFGVTKEIIATEIHAYIMEK